MKGGGKKPSHDYAKECFDIGHLSRVAVLVLVPMPGVNWLSPTITQLDGTQMGSVYLLLHSEQVVVSLDPICPTGIVRKIPVTHNENILQVHPQFIDCYCSIQRMQADIIGAAEAATKAANGRRKRQTPDDEQYDEDGNDMAC